MNKSIKLILIYFFSIILFLIFSFLEFEPLNKESNKYLQAAIFALVFLMSVLKPKLRIKAYKLSFLFLLMIVGFYLAQQIDLANSLSSILVGVLLIISLTYLSEIVRKGYVERK